MNNDKVSPLHLLVLPGCNGSTCAHDVPSEVTGFYEKEKEV